MKCLNAPRKKYPYVSSTHERNKCPLETFTNCFTPERGGGATETYQTPSWVTVFTTGNQPPPHIPSMWVSVFESKKVSPPRLTSMWVSVFLLDDGAA